MTQNARLDPALIYQSTTLREYDATVNRIVFGYETVDQYYRDASSINYVTRVRIPLLCMNADDDPLCPVEALPFDEAE